MISMSEKLYTISKVESLPKGKFRARSLIYDQIIADIEKSPAGCYEVNVAGKKQLTIFSALSKRLKDKPNLKLHTRVKKIYVEKLAKK